MAGGKGTRFNPLSFYFQKTMIPVGHRFKPLLEYIIRNIVFNGINKLLISVSYKYEQVIGFVNNLDLRSVTIDFMIDEGKGNGYALIKAYRLGLLNEENILIHYGDILTNLNILDLIKHHTSRACDCTVVVVKGYKLPVGVVEVDNDSVINVIEKPIVDVNVGIGVFVMSRDAIRRVSEKLKLSAIEIDIARDILPLMIHKLGAKVCAYTPKQKDFFWIDIGTPDVYQKLDHALIDKIFKYLFNDVRLGDSG